MHRCIGETFGAASPSSCNPVRWCSWSIRSCSRGTASGEATTARGATRWIDERPDIDALVVEDDLPDGRGADLAASLAAREHPLAKHTIVMTRARPQPAGGITVVERGDLRAVMSTLTSWFAVRDLPQARRLGEVWSRLPSRIAALRPRS